MANAAGIDLSSFQPSFDWEAEKGRISFAFIKATDKDKSWKVMVTGTIEGQTLTVKSIALDPSGD